MNTVHSPVPLEDYLTVCPLAFAALISGSSGFGFVHPPPPHCSHSDKHIHILIGNYTTILMLDTNKRKTIDKCYISIREKLTKRDDVEKC